MTAVLEIQEKLAPALEDFDKPAAVEDVRKTFHWLCDSYFAENEGERLVETLQHVHTLYKEETAAATEASETKWEDAVEALNERF